MAEDDEEWTFSVEEVAAGGDEFDALEPGAPSIENAVFFVLGVLAAVALFLAMIP